MCANIATGMVTLLIGGVGSWADSGHLQRVASQLTARDEPRTRNTARPHHQQERTPSSRTPRCTTAGMSQDDLTLVLMLADRAER